MDLKRSTIVCLCGSIYEIIHICTAVVDEVKSAQHEIHNLRIFNSSVKNRKYKASSLRTSSAFCKDA